MTTALYYCERCKANWPVSDLKRGVCPHCKRNKHGNVHTSVNGILFASMKEAARYRELLMLQQMGEVSAILLQPCFPITVPDPEGKHVLVANYYADFQYQDKAGQTVVEDVKGESTRKDKTYRLKKKLVEALYGMTITEV